MLTPAHYRANQCARGIDRPPSKTSIPLLIPPPTSLHAYLPIPPRKYPQSYSFTHSCPQPTMHTEPTVPAPGPWCTRRSSKQIGSAWQSGTAGGCCGLRAALQRPRVKCVGAHPKALQIDNLGSDPVGRGWKFQNDDLQSVSPPGGYTRNVFCSVRQMHEVRNDARQQFASSIRWWIPKGQKHTGDEWLQEDSSGQERSVCERWRCVEILAPGVSCFVLMIAHREKPFQDSFQNPRGQVSTHLGLRTPGTQKELSKVYFIKHVQNFVGDFKNQVCRFPGLQHFITNFYRGPWQAPGWMSSFKRSGPVRSAEHQKRGNGRKAIKKAFGNQDMWSSGRTHMFREAIQTHQKWAVFKLDFSRVFFGFPN